MLCPNCSEQLVVIEVSGQKVLHCTNCGGNFFEENGINRISAQDAETLTQDTANNVVMGTPKICPRDSLFMRSIEKSEAIPHNVTLYKCPKCHGIFAYPDDLLRFKTAQIVKIEFFKIWGNPLPSLKSVLVLGIIAAISLTIFTNLNNKALRSTNATDYINNVQFSKRGRYLFINFKTDKPYSASIMINDRTSHITSIVPLDQKAAKIHFTTITDVSLSHELYYQIIITDEKGTSYKSVEKPVVISEGL